MAKKISFLILLIFVFYLLLKDKESTTVQEYTIEKKENPLIKTLLDTALSYEGTPYKFGGTTVAGMDCSGLVYTSYKKLNITLSRASRNMFHNGEEVRLDAAKKGDLLFFDIDKFEGRVNHVGMVTSVDEDGTIKFIHSTTKQGVIITSIEESYWKKAFVGVKRILN